MKRAESVLNKRCVVLKFGGTSVASQSCWETISNIALERLNEGIKPIIVCSAASGVSDLLEMAIRDSVSGKHKKCVEAIKSPHQNLADDLKINIDCISKHLGELKILLDGVSKVGEFSPRIRAKVLSLGELMLTRLGSAYLNSKGIGSTWIDVRDWLISEDLQGSTDYRRFGSATCDYAADNRLVEAIDGDPSDVIVTQGFIARDSRGETVLLGRGGSDVSASYISAKVGAIRCEIWTDVPGMYTANPHKVPSARIIRALDYDEAQEIATLGAKVLHPRCLHPLKKHDIPLYIKCIARPDADGTIVSSSAANPSPGVKAISMKQGIVIISMESVEMWHQVGFLADVFECFKRHGVSIDLISTSETNVTVTIDQVAGGHDPKAVGDLVRDLTTFCKPSLIDSCAFISLVGRNIRGILHRLSPAFEVFEEKKIYMVSQAANDLNLTFVVDEDEAERLVSKIHAELIPPDAKHDHLGESWQDLFGEATKDETSKKWWIEKRAKLLEVAAKETPIYVYDEGTIKGRIDNLKAMQNIDRVFYSVKANSHPDILKTIYSAGFGFECVSSGEMKHIFNNFPKIDPKRIVFTPNFVPREEYERAILSGVFTTLDNMYPLKNWPEIFAVREIMVRIDTGEGFGHHKYVHTAGSKSKFGISMSELEELKDISARNKTKIVGLHAHVGSNILRAETWAEIAASLSKIAAEFTDVRYIDVGGGLGIAERPGKISLDTHEVDAHLEKFKKEFPKIEIWLEPGRFVVAESGVLLASVTQTKKKGGYFYVGIDAGMNSLIRPALYGAFHEIVNLSHPEDDPMIEANIVGPICESGDVLGYGRQISSPSAGDIILIATAGAYGHVMSSSYNMRDPADEYFLGEGS